MPLESAPVTVTPLWGNLYIKMTPHPLDMAALAANGGQLPADHVPLSVFQFAYGEFGSGEDYAKILTPEKVQPRRKSGEATLTGSLVRSIVNHVAFHALASQLIAKVVSDELTEEQRAEMQGVDQVRRAMAGATADFQFGTAPFTVEAPNG